VTVERLREAGIVSADRLPGGQAAEVPELDPKPQPLPLDHAAAVLLEPTGRDPERTDSLADGGLVVGAVAGVERADALDAVLAGNDRVRLSQRRPADRQRGHNGGQRKQGCAIRESEHDGAKRRRQTGPRTDRVPVVRPVPSGC